MAIDRMHALLANISENFHLDVLAAKPVVAAVDHALSTHGKLCCRKMPLKPRLVFWLVILLALRRERSIPNVFALIIEAARSLAPGLSRDTVTDGGLAKARHRLGSAPFKTFFHALADLPITLPSFYGLRPCAMDGVRLTMPDTDENCSRFPKQSTGRGKAAWPQMLAVCLLDIRNRRIIDAQFDEIHGSERALGRLLWNRLDEKSVLIEDRGFFKAEDFFRLQESGRKFLCKLPAKPTIRIVAEHGRGDYLIELRGRREREGGEACDTLLGRGKNSRTKKFKSTVRLIVYRIGEVEHRLVTNVFDRRISPEKFARIYHWRWDIEMSYDELKVHLMSVRHGKAQTVFRSKSPELVEQEFWAMLSAYNLVRDLMTRAAKQSGEDALNMSFTDSLAVIEDHLLLIQQAPFGELLRWHRRLMQSLSRCTIDRPRRQRQWPRVVKSKMSNFKVKRAYHKESELLVVIKLPELTEIAS